MVYKSCYIFAISIQLFSWKCIFPNIIHLTITTFPLNMLFTFKTQSGFCKRNEKTLLIQRSPRIVSNNPQNHHDLIPDDVRPNLSEDLLELFIYPPKGMCGSTPDGVQLISLLQLLCHQITKTEVSKTRARRRFFFSAKNLYCAGGWVDGGQKGPSIFLKFKYVDNYVMKILNIGKTFVTNFLMSLKI